MGLEEYLNARYSKGTVAAYLRDIRAYRGDMVRAERATYRDITAYLGRLRERSQSPATLQRTLSAIKVYHAYLVASGERGDDPARSIRLRDRKVRDVQLQDLFTREELERLLEREERYPLLAPRNRVLMGLLLHQAPTPTELERLRTEDVLLKEGRVRIGPTPRTNERELELRPEQVMLFHEYLQDTRERLLKGKRSDRLLVGTRGNPMVKEDITKHVKRHYRGFFPGRKVNATTIRQSVIAELLKEGHDLRKVQVFAGHKYPSTTEKYKRTDAELLRAEVEKYHPMG